MILLGITGQKQSGKDTVLKCIRELLPSKAILQRNFADALKLEVALGCNVDVDFVNEHKENFRLILQGWGTDFRRRLFGDDYWIKKWMIAMSRTVTNPFMVVCTDVRFLNEAEAIRNLGGILWRVNRTNSDRLPDLHQSEVELNGIETDSVLFNNYTVENLKTETNKLLIKHGIRTN